MADKRKEKKKKRYCGCALSAMVILAVVFLALVVISFIGGNMGALILGTEPVSILAVHQPRPELPAEMPFSGLPITNTMITAWIGIVVMIVLFAVGARKMKLIPAGVQNLVETIYEVAANFIEDAAGKEYGRKFFAVCTTIFLFVLANAWINLIPGIESIKMNGVPLFRNANTDVNVPLMLAMVSFCYVEFWGFKAKGFKYITKFFNFGPLFQGLRQLFKGRLKIGLSGMAMGLIAIFVGILELLSEFIRIISFTFRLFGNMTAGSMLTLVIIFLIPWVVPVIFYGLEAFLGFIQAMIFGALTLCFLTMAVKEAEEESA